MKFTVLVLAMATLAWGRPLEQNMREVGLSMSTLLERSASQNDFEDAKSLQVVEAELKKLDTLFIENAAHFKSREAGPELDALRSMVKDARSAHAKKNFDFSRQLIRGLPHLCLSCHSQDQFHGIMGAMKEPAGLSLLERAYFALSTRRPEEAQLGLLAFMKDRSVHDEKSLIKAGRLQIHLGLWQGLSSREIIARLHEMKRLVPPKSIAERTFVEWIKGTEVVSKAMGVSPSNLGDWRKKFHSVYGEVPVFGTLVSPYDEAILLTFRQELHRLLRTASDVDKPWAHYWMAVCERGLGHTYFYSLGDGYLRQCMNRWPKSPAAKRCYDEYKQYVEFGFTGSAGTDIPADVKKEMEDFRTRVGR